MITKGTMFDVEFVNRFDKHFVLPFESAMDMNTEQIVGDMRDVAKGMSCRKYRLLVNNMVGRWHYSGI